MTLKDFCETVNGKAVVMVNNDKKMTIKEILDSGLDILDCEVAYIDVKDGVYCCETIQHTVNVDVLEMRISSFGDYLKEKAYELAKRYFEEGGVKRLSVVDEPEIDAYQNIGLVFNILDWEDDE